MRSKILTTADASGGNKTSVNVTDPHLTPFNIGLGCVVTGTATYSIEHSFDDPALGEAGMTWFSHATIVAQTTNKDGNYSFPVRAVRLKQTAGTGSVAATLIQAGLM